MRLSFTLSAFLGGFAALGLGFFHGLLAWLFGLAFLGGFAALGLGFFHGLLAWLFGLAFLGGWLAWLSTSYSLCGPRSPFTEAAFFVGSKSLRRLFSFCGFDNLLGLSQDRVFFFVFARRLSRPNFNCILN